MSAVLPERLLSGCQRDFTLEHLFIERYVDEALPCERRLFSFVLPSWQRKEVWSLAQKVRFIEGLFLGLGAGYYVVSGVDWGDDGKSLPFSGYLIDGQQRISAIRDFVAGELAVFDGIRYGDLSIPEQRRFRRLPFPCFDLEYTGDEAVLKELYERLNFGGTPHTPDDLALLARS